MLQRSPWLDVMLTLVILALLAALVWRFGEIENITAAGVVQVVDGDSLVLNGMRLRLQGIDAPELGQTCARDGKDFDCGRAARAKLRELIGGRHVECSGWQRDKYERLLSSCTSRTVELNREMVLSGWAVAYGEFAAQEQAARLAKRGLWQGQFEQPQQWRRMRGALAEAPHDMWLTIMGLFAAMTGNWKGG